MPADNPVTTLRTDKGQGIDKHRDEINAWANQVNAALAGATGAEAVDFVANFLSLNSSYRTAVAEVGGLVVNVLPTATVDTTVGAGVVTAGVDTVSDPTMTTAGSAFSAADIIMITGSEDDGANDGFYEVVSHAANLLTLRSTSFGITNRVESFTRDQLIAGTDTGMLLTKVTVAALRAGTDGVWEAAFGDTTPLTYADLVSVGDTPALVATNFTGIAAGGIDPDATTHIASDGTDHSRVGLNSDGGSVPIWDYEGVNQPTAGDTLTMGADVYEFRATATAISNDAFVGVLIGGNAAATLVNLVAAANGAGTGIADGILAVGGGGPLLIEDGTENVLAAVNGTLMTCQAATAPGGSVLASDPSIVLAESVTDAACIWVQGNINVNTLGGRAAGSRAYGRSAPTAVTAAHITDTLIAFAFTFTPVDFRVSVRSAGGLPRFGSAAAAVDGPSDTFAIVGDTIECTLAAGGAQDIVATDVITVEAWSA